MDENAQIRFFWVKYLGWYIYGHIVSFQFLHPESRPQCTKVDSWKDPYFFFFDKKWGKNQSIFNFSLFFSIEFMKIPQNFVKNSQTFM